ncbi:MAG: glycosyltransferase [Opitutaceae bacterium]
MIASTKTFRLLHFQNTANSGGDESNSLLLCRHLPDMEHHISVYFGAGPMAQTWREVGAAVELLKLDPASRSGFMAAVRRTVARVQPDGIFLSSIVLLPLVLKALDGFGGQVLCHTGNPEARSLGTRLKFWAARAWLRPKVQVTMVHCSDYVRKSYRRSSFYRRYRHEVAISAGLLDNLEQVRSHMPRVVSRDAPVRIGMVARLDPIKNHRLVIDAFRLILNDYPQAKLEFIGEGTEMKNLQAHALALGLSDQVIFHGRLPSPFPVACEWDLFLYGTTRAEGFGAALAEAIALGLPCVVTDVGPMREVGGEDGTVCYVPADSDTAFAAAATELLDDYPRRCSMSEQSRSRAGAMFGGAAFAEKIRRCLLSAPLPAAGAMSASSAT